MLAKAIILGRVGKIESKSTKNGANRIVISLATKDKYLDTNGAAIETTTWHNVSFYSKLAEIAEKYVHTGDLLYIEGSINYKKGFENNADKWFYSVTGTSLKLLPNNKHHASEPGNTQETAGNSIDEEIPF